MSNPAAVSLGRVGAMVLRYTYLLRSSWPRLLEIVYWPAVQMLTWGFLQTYLVQAQGVVPNTAAIAAGALIGGVLLWDILLRGQQGFSFSFLEEMWSRNIPNLLMSPLRPAEFVAALMVMSLIRLAVGVVPVTLMAITFFGFNLWALGVAFAAFFVVLIFFAWSVGLLVSGILLRYGLGAENLVWSLMFIIQPLGCQPTALTSSNGSHEGGYCHLLA
jgi:ABC-2 type transport system permease protein